MKIRNENLKRITDCLERDFMSYQEEWLLFEAGDDIDELEHRQPDEEFLFYKAVANGDVEAVKKNCEQGRFVERLSD